MLRGHRDHDSWGELGTFASSYRILPRFHLYIYLSKFDWLRLRCPISPVVSVIAFEVLIDARTDVTTLLGELDVGNDKAVNELVVLRYSELRSLASQ